MNSSKNPGRWCGSWQRPAARRRAPAAGPCHSPMPSTRSPGFSDRGRANQPGLQGSNSPPARYGSRETCTVSTPTGQVPTQAPQPLQFSAVTTSLRCLSRDIARNRQAVTHDIQNTPPQLRHRAWSMCMPPMTGTGTSRGCSSGQAAAHLPQKVHPATEKSSHG